MLGKQNVWQVVNLILWRNHGKTLIGTQGDASRMGMSVQILRGYNR